MTAKQFFKGNVFKCIVTLLCVLLISGVFLTFAYGFLKVSYEERLNRAISKIYGKSVSVTDVDFTGEQSKQGNATILNVYKDGDGNYLLKSKGTGGFAGTVTCWVLVYVKDGKVGSVNKVVVESSDGETFLNKINHLNKFPDTQYTDDFEYTTDNGFVTTDATLSSTAINNCVNGAVSFVRFVVLGETFVDPYADFAFHDFIDMENTDWETSGDTVTYSIATKKNGPANGFNMTISVENGSIASYEITAYGSTDNGYEGVTKEEYNGKINLSLYIGKDVDYFKAIIGDDGADTTNANYADNGISTGATKSNYLCLAAGAFATANYDYCKTHVSGGEANE